MIAVTDSKVYQVRYWDPCNGIGGRSQSKGHFATREAAERFINDKVGEPGSAKRLDPNNWDRDAYSISEIEVQQ